jgi:hypothetical protein
MSISFRNSHLRALVAAVILGTQACYSFVPLASGANPRIGQPARVRLTAEGTAELARYLGPNVAWVEGNVVSIADDGTIMMAVETVEQTNELRQPWTGEGVVAIPAKYRAEAHGRVFQKRRSIVASALLGVGLIALGVIAFRGVGSGEGGIEVPPPPP